MEKKLTRSKDKRILAGVMGGLGEFFGIDPTLLRLGYVILTVFSGFFPGIIGYILAVLIVPEEQTGSRVEPVAADDTDTI